MIRLDGSRGQLRPGLNAKADVLGFTARARRCCWDDERRLTPMGVSTARLSTAVDVTVDGGEGGSR